MIGHCPSRRGPARAREKEKSEKKRKRERKDTKRERGGDPRVFWTTDGHLFFAWQGISSVDWLELDVTLNDSLHSGRL